MKSDFEHKKVLQGNTCHTIALYVRGKTFYDYERFGGKKFLRKPGAHNRERATAINSCNGVFTSEFIFR